MGHRPYLIDAFDLGVNTKGIHRVLMSLVPQLRASGHEMRIATSRAGAESFAADDNGVVIVPMMKKSVWEQVGLPRIARRHGCCAIYSHREAGALWGPPLVLHLPEDPGVRWARKTPTGPNDRLRRVYSRALLQRSISRAAIVATSSAAIGEDVARRYHVEAMRTIPLGVDHELFKPAPEPREESIFHLGSFDPRDCTAQVVEAYALARRTVTLPPLRIAGRLGPVVGADVARQITDRSLEQEVEFLGWVADVDLADHYRHAMVVIQPASDEGFGLQPLEALASGAPLIVAATPAVAELAGDAARVVPPGPEALSAALVELAIDLDRRQELRRAAVLTAAPFTWRATADRVIEALARAAERGRRSSC